MPSNELSIRFHFVRLVISAFDYFTSDSMLPFLHLQRIKIDSILPWLPFVFIPICATWPKKFKTCRYSALEISFSLCAFQKSDKMHDSHSRIDKPIRRICYRNRIYMKRRRAQCSQEDQEIKAMMYYTNTRTAKFNWIWKLEKFNEMKRKKKFYSNRIQTTQKNPKHKFGHIITEPAGSERGRTISRISVAKGSNLNFRGRKSNSLMNLCGKAPIQILFLCSLHFYWLKKNWIENKMKSKKY